MLFANTNIVISADGKTVGPNQRIPEGLDPAFVQELVDRGLVFEHEDPKPSPAPPAPDADPLAQGKWAFDPKGIAGDSLDVLNMKILGHVQRFGLAAVPPFEDAEEARAFMSLERSK